MYGYSNPYFGRSFLDNLNNKKYDLKKLDDRIIRRLKREIHSVMFKEKNDMFLNDYLKKIEFMLELLKKQKISFADTCVQSLISNIGLFYNSNINCKEIIKELRKIEFDCLTPLGKLVENKLKTFKDKEEINELKNELKLYPDYVKELSKISVNAFEDFYILTQPVFFNNNIKVNINEGLSPFGYGFELYKFDGKNQMVDQYTQNIIKIMFYALKNKNFDLYSYMVGKYANDIIISEIFSALCHGFTYDINIFEYLIKKHSNMEFKKESIDKLLVLCEKNIDLKGYKYFKSILHGDS